MITKDNFKDVLKYLDFKEDRDIFSKKVNGNLLKVDFKNKELIYPKNLIINETQTCNFSDDENFVVFECIHRLLEKGYRPEHIEIEKRWKIGHTRKGGRADITIHHQIAEADDIEVLMIIECKTFGAKYQKARKQLKEDGGQLFSYWQQARSAQWLSLYASDFSDNQLIFENEIIEGKDDKNFELLAQKDSTIKLYSQATDVIGLFDVWSATYNQKLWEGLIFGENTSAYQIGVKPLLKRDLKEITKEEKKDNKLINEFEEILRHNNISDKENAFNRLIALFICKLVDEMTKNEDEEVDFQYKQGIDTYETLQDRLQKLYRTGMDKFMKEDIFYIPSNYAQDFLSKYQGEQREEAIKELEEQIRKLKFYSNNDFAFKDVHNEKLFLQNGKVLVEMVQLFEKYRIIFPSKHQFLGDLFEKLLDKGFKQNEGQFFTPTPITRFIWDSLPLKRVIMNNNNEFPKVIDYACGSGHFLTEAVEAINAVANNQTSQEMSNSNDWVRDKIWGIEKDYRLARVSKVAMFMNGAGDTNIVFGDGLDNNSENHIKNNQFDILVANPPYSVASFKSHLKLFENDLELLERISNNGSEIEVLFVERISQLLKSQGIAAVILPSSILNNGSNSYIGAREFLLKEFFVRAIVALGNKTFSATGTNTVILFLEKLPYPPRHQDLIKDNIKEIFSNSKTTSNWGEVELYEAYLNHISIFLEDYEEFISENLSLEELEKVAYFKEYITVWSNLTKTKQTKKTIENKQKSIKKKKETIGDEKDDKKRERINKQINILNQRVEELENGLQRECYRFIKEIEREKLYYFALTYNQKTMIISAPESSGEQKNFLGYGWTTRKGYEGIVINQLGGKMYDDNNRFAKQTLAHAIRKSFNQEKIELLEDNKEFAKWVKTADMLDFESVNFNKSIMTSVQKRVETKSKYPLVKIGDISSQIIEGKTPSKSISEYWNSNDIFWFTTPDFSEFSININNASQYVSQSALNDNKVKLVPVNSVLLSCTATLGKIGINRIPLTTNQQIKSIIFNDVILPEFFVYYFKSSDIDLGSLTNNSGVKHINLTTLSELKIPLPPINIQQKIVAECEQVDKDYENSRMKIEEYREKIAKVFTDLEVLHSSGRVNNNKSIRELCSISSGGTPSRKNQQYWIEGTIPWVKTGELNHQVVMDTEEKITQLGLKNSSAKMYQAGDIIVAMYGATIGKTAKLGINATTNQACAVLFDFKDGVLNDYVWYFLRTQTEKLKQLAYGSAQPNLNARIIADYKIPLPSFQEQQSIVFEIETLEQKISELEEKMAQAPARKKAILDSYLN